MSAHYCAYKNYCRKIMKKNLVYIFLKKLPLFLDPLFMNAFFVLVINWSYELTPHVTEVHAVRKIMQIKSNTYIIIGRVKILMEKCVRKLCKQNSLTLTKIQRSRPVNFV